MLPAQFVHGLAGRVYWFRLAASNLQAKFWFPPPPPSPLPSYILPPPHPTPLFPFVFRKSLLHLIEFPTARVKNLTFFNKIGSLIKVCTERRSIWTLFWRGGGWRRRGGFELERWKRLHLFLHVIQRWTYQQLNILWACWLVDITSTGLKSLRHSISIILSSAAIFKLFSLTLSTQSNEHRNKWMLLTVLTFFFFVITEKVDVRLVSTEPESKK